MTDGGTSILIGANCKSEEEAARVLEAFSRTIVGLVLDGITINIMRLED
jgi:hypothetical protein